MFPKLLAFCFDKVCERSDWDYGMFFTLRSQFPFGVLIEFDHRKSTEHLPGAVCQIEHIGSERMRTDPGLGDDAHNAVLPDWLGHDETQAVTRNLRHHDNEAVPVCIEVDKEVRCFFCSIGKGDAAAVLLDQTGNRHHNAGGLVRLYRGAVGRYDRLVAKV